MFRATISDDKLRQELLASVCELKKFQRFKHMFIHRDLTFNQRESLRNRRAEQYGKAMRSPSNEHQKARPNIQPVERKAFVRGRGSLNQRKYSEVAGRPAVSSTRQGKTPTSDMCETFVPSRTFASGERRRRTFAQQRQPESSSHLHAGDRVQPDSSDRWSSPCITNETGGERLLGRTSEAVRSGVGKPKVSHHRG